jgi:tetratricopeptide (TPR) repeat protein
MRRLIQEIHRRSLWQVMGIYLGVSWGALQVVDGITKSAGLPDWVPGFALVLLVIGFPVVVATAFVQEGLPGGRGARSGEAGGGEAATGVAAAEGATGAPGGSRAASRPLAAGIAALDQAGTRTGIQHRLFTWRNALLGGVAAFALLGLAVAGYFVMRLTGIGPVASLAAQGLIDAGEPIVIAEFENTSSDPSLGDVVTEALRVDLTGSPALTPLAPARIQEVLRLMQRSPDERLSPALAREVAIREGIRAVLEGEVASAGSGFIVLATLRSPESQAALATFRRTARSADEVIDAIDKLSQDIREKAGESLKSIRAAPPLARVTTASLEALRKYVEAERTHGAGNEQRALELAREAVALDSTFAMAYRRIATLELNLSGGYPTPAAVEAATRAYELRDRLTELERYQTEASYHRMVTGDIDALIRAYERVLAVEPDDRAALNNLAGILMERTRYEEAAELLRRAVSGPGRTASAVANLAIALALLPDPEGARAVLEEAKREYPAAAGWHGYYAGLIALAAGDYAEAHAEGERLAVLPDASPAFRLRGQVIAAQADAGRGRLAEVRRHLAELHARARQLSHSDVVQAHAWEALIERLFGTPEVTRAAIQAALQALDSVPAESRETHFADLADEAIRAGDAALAGGVLERWEAERPAESRDTRSREMHRLVGIIETAVSDPAGAASQLEAFRTERRCPRCFTFELAALYARAGRMQQAAAAWEEVVAKPAENWLAGLTTALAHERLGEAYEVLGEPAKAAEHYARFAELWKDADPELQPRVRYARERAAALLAERG